MRVYKPGTPVDRLIEAVLAVSTSNDDETREMAGSDASATLVKIRELVSAYRRPDRCAEPHPDLSRFAAHRLAVRVPGDRI